MGSEEGEDGEIGQQGDGHGFLQSVQQERVLDFSKTI